MTQSVAELIEEVRRRSAKRLDLSGQQLEAPPAGLTDLPHLEEIDFSNNRFLTDLPESLSSLPALQRLDLRNTQVGGFPAGCGVILGFQQYIDLDAAESGVRILGLEVDERRSQQFLELAQDGRFDEIEWLELSGDFEDGLPALVPRLTNLSLLRVAYSRLPGLPVEIGNLSALTHLDLSGNHLVELPETFSNLKLLQHLNLNENRFTAVPAAIDGFPALATLAMDSNEVDEIPSWLQGKRLLTELNLCNNRIRHIETAHDPWPALRTLDLALNQLQDLPPALATLKSLQRLDLRSSPLGTVPEAVLAMTALHSLHLGKCRLESLPAEIAGLTKLRTLEVPGNRLTELPTEIGELAGLEMLDASDNQLTGLPDEIGQLQALKTLDLHGNALQDLPASLTTKTLVSLNLSNNQLTQLPAAVCALAGLSTLKLENTGIERLPEAIRALQNLLWLHLADNRIDTLPQAIGELVSLQTLDVSRNCLTGLPDTLADLTALHYLQLAGNRFAQPPPVLQSLTSIKRLDLSDNLLEEIPAWLPALPGLSMLDINGNPQNNLPAEMTSRPLSDIATYLEGLSAGHFRNHDALIVVLGDEVPNRPGWIDLLSRVLGAGVNDGPKRRTALAQLSLPNGPTLHLLLRDLTGSTLQPPDTRLLPKRSLYILAMSPIDTGATDGSEEVPEALNRQLQSIATASGHSPILIAYQSGNPIPTALSKLRGQHGVIKVLRTGSTTNDALGEQILDVMQQPELLPHVGAAYPIPWRLALGDLLILSVSQPSIDGQRFDEVCARHGIEEGEYSELAAYLVQTGAVLQLPPGPEDAGGLILDSSAFLETLLHIDSLDLDASGGLVSADRMSTSGTTETGEEAGTTANAMPELLQRFGYCFCSTAEPDQYVVPTRLAEHPNEPRTTRLLEQTVGHPHLILRFAETDPSVLARLCSRFLAESPHQICWRNGALLDCDDDCALLKIDAASQQLQVRMLRNAAHPRLAEIYRACLPFTREADHEMLMPCLCAGCQQNADPVLYPVDTLRAERLASVTLNCPRTLAPVVIDQLLWRVGLADAPAASTNAFPADGEPAPAPTRPNPAHSSEPVVFVSYTWSAASEDVVDQLQAAFEGRKVRLIRDKQDMQYKDSISKFMETLGQGSAVAVIVSKAYLESDSCMTELIKIARNRSFYDRVFPIVLEDAHIYEPVRRVEYLKYWETKKAELSKALEGVDKAKTRGLHEELNLYDDIRSTIDGLLSILKDMNTFTPERLQRDGFATVVEAIEAKLKP